ncbi:MAG: dephospho-CoA kinase [Candidatus Krumholzibacteriia bacterium]|nr:dephospho-CoA kinase [Candidatus Latescibacterota bacterium]
MRRPDSRVWVVTGPMGSGKSTVCRLLEQCCAAVLDADALSHRLLARHDEVHAGLRALFGEAVFGADGRPDRRLIGERVFADPGLLGKLEALLHPHVLSELADKAADWRARGSGLLVMEVVLWFQLSQRPFAVDGVLLTWAPPERLVERVAARSGLAAHDVARRLAAQGDWERWTAQADRVLNTDCDLAELERRVRVLLPALLAAPAP